jgi:hypothetical protein
MSIREMSVLTCNGCGTNAVRSWPGGTEYEIDGWMQANGWEVADGRDLCSACVKVLEAESAPDPHLALEAARAKADAAWEEADRMWKLYQNDQTSCYGYEPAQRAAAEANHELKAAIDTYRATTGAAS